MKHDVACVHHVKRKYLSLTFSKRGKYSISVRTSGKHVTVHLYSSLKQRKGGLPNEF